jgi:hypothetical protein
MSWRPGRAQPESAQRSEALRRCYKEIESAVRRPRAGADNALAERADQIFASHRTNFGG